MKTFDLTDNCLMKFNVDKLRAELKDMQDGLWLEHYDPTLSRGWKSIPLVSRNGETSGAESQRAAPTEDMRRTPLTEKLPYFTQILDFFECPQGRIRITRLDPGAGINMHRDISAEVANLAFNKVRLHIPIETNDGVYFWVDNDIIRMKPGRLYYVNFSKRHYVRNEGDTPRYHLVLDLEVNDWLRKLFPSPTILEHFQMKLEKQLLPIQWKIINTKIALIVWFWKHYNGSSLQKIRNKLRGK